VDEVARFLEVYPLGAAAVAEALGDWTIGELGRSDIRTGIDVALTRPGSARLLVSIEPRIEGAEHCAATRDLHLSYYADAGVDHRAAAEVVRALGRALAAFERSAPRRSLPVLDGGGREVIEVRINRECNERCSFCNTPEDSRAILPGRAAILERIAAAGHSGGHALTITGRETTLDANLPDYLRAARAAGFTAIQVQSNGTTLGHRPLLERLVGAGMNALEMSLHTVDADTFERLIGARSLLPKALAGLTALAEFPAVRVTLVIVMTSLNADQVPALIETVATDYPHVRGVVLSPVAPVGDATGQPHLLLPYDQLSVHMTAALERAAARGLEAHVPDRCGMPPCTLPASVRHHHEAARGRGQPIEPGKSKPDRCRACSLDRTCGGAWTAYLDHFGDRALLPI
jgi:pyruvate-formate lyase-activating enzyme